MIELKGMASAPTTSSAAPLAGLVRSEVKRAARKALRNRSYVVRREGAEPGRREFEAEATRINQRHQVQTVDDVEALREKHRTASLAGSSVITGT